MNVCTMPGCQTTAGCLCQSIPPHPWPYGEWNRPQYPALRWPAPPRFLPVNMPLPEYGGVTIAILDKDGNLTIKVEQQQDGEWTVPEPSP